MAKKKDKVRHINCLLIKEDYTEFSEVLRDDVSCTSYSLKEDVKTDAEIFIGEQTQKEPNWIGFLNTASETKITGLQNTSNRAVLLVREKGRIFAIVFGYGRYLLKDEAIVYDFGFRVAVNAVDPDKLKSIDIANLEELTVHSRVQASADSSKEAFGLDILNDLMRSVTGVPRNKRLAKTITGKDSVIFNAEMKFDDIRKKCRLLLVEYGSKKYKEQFDWIDNLSEERDKTIIEELQQSLITDIKKRNIAKLHLAPPEPIDWDDIVGFNYIRYDADEEFFPALDFEDYYKKVKTLDSLTFENLKDQKLLIHYAQSDKKLSKWKIYKCLTYETERTNSNSGQQEKYVYTLSHWYKIETNFVNSIVKDVKGIPSSGLNLIDCSDNNEGDYNEKLAESDPNYYLLDKVNVKCESARTAIEPCDVLTRDLHFIHIKQKHNSANLSHLFSQGRISSESLIKDDAFVKNIKSKAKSAKNMDLDFIPDDGIMESRDCKIVFGIIDKSEKDLFESLPFFSLLNLRQSAVMLRLLGFSVYLDKIKKITATGK